MLGPVSVWFGAREGDAVVQAEGAVMPELDGDGHNAKAGPVRRARHGADGIFCGVDGNGLLEREAAFERAGLLAGPCADAAIARAALEIGVGIGIADLLDRTANTHLALQALPVEHDGCLSGGEELRALGGAGIGVEYEALRIITLHQDHANIGHAFGINGGECHGIRIIGFAGLGIVKPCLKEIERLLGGGEVTVC